MTTPLPTPKALLTSLLQALTTPPTTPTNQNLTNPPTQTVNPRYEPPTNPLKSLPASHRALLSTLHVLLPTGVLLQALDLLDRGLVVRVTEQPPTSITENEKDEGKVVPPQAHVHLPGGSTQAQASAAPDAQAQAPPAPPVTTNPEIASRLSPAKETLGKEPKTGMREGRKNVIYQVRSSQAPKSKFRDGLGTGGGSLTYTVRLEAWNCSCAAFAFESFPASISRDSPWTDLGESSDEEELDGEMGGQGTGGGRDRMEEGDWEFGGLSFDGKTGGEGKVPVCKHLLACLLAKKWEGVLGVYVKENGVRRDEMGGLGGEG